ncbi:MAG: amidase [Rhodospirillaceae bacterium]|nr:amidase [Rhodospirillaceae bacterium]
MIDLELCYMPATEALTRFRARTLSPVEIVTAQIARAEATEPTINAYADRYFDEALDTARKAEARYAKPGGRPRTLEGLTLAIKDEAAIKGRRSTYGSLIYKDNIATKTNPTIERLLRAGAIPIGRTNCPEFSCAWITDTRIHGTTRSPWNRTFTCGGSSGGSGAALAAGSTTLATGSDIGGSIRIPSALCGTVGFKPPHGRNPDETPFNMDLYSVIGPMARTVADIALMQNVTAGPHPLDMDALRPKLRLPTAFKGIEGVKIGYSYDLGFWPIHEDVREQMTQALAALESAGAIVEPVDLVWTPDMQRGCESYLDHLFGRGLARELERHRDLLCDYTIWYAERAGKTTAEDFLHALEMAGQFHDRVGPLLEKYQVLICPTVPTNEVHADQRPSVLNQVAGRTIDTDYEWPMTHPFNMLGRLPVLAVPAGIGRNGLPVGLQIVARAFDDARCFRVAAALERARPWLDTPARRPKL